MIHPFSNATIPSMLRTSLLVTLVATMGPGVARAGGSPHTTHGPTPVWVSPVSWSASSEEDTASERFLLRDRQVNLARGVSYVREVIQFRRVPDAPCMIAVPLPSGVGAVDMIEIHAMTLHRGALKREIGLPATTDIRPVETDAVRRHYIRTTAAFLPVPAPEPGDIVDFSCSLHWHSGHADEPFAHRISFGSPFPTERAHIRLIYPAGRTIGCNDEDATAILRGPVREYVLDFFSIDPDIRDSTTPDWYLPYPEVTFSEYSDWSAVAHVLAPMYAPERASSLISLTTRLTRRVRKEHERAVRILRYVQDSLKTIPIPADDITEPPASPTQVIARRWGDSREKSRTLQSLLAAQKIHARVMLVHSWFGAWLEESLVSPLAFDHAVVSIDLDGKTYIVDPTRRFQRGTLEMTYCPDYTVGLPMDGIRHDLEGMESGRGHGKTERTEELHATDSSAAATLTVETVYDDLDADKLREYLATGTAEMLGGSLQALYAARYPGILTEHIEVRDNEPINQIRVMERYAIPFFWQRDSSNPAEARGTLYPVVAAAELVEPGDTTSYRPLALPHPVDFRNTISIDIPGVSLPPVEDVETDDAFMFFSRWESVDSVVRVKYTYQTKDDYVRGYQRGAYARSLSRIHKRLGLTLIRTRDGIRTSRDPARRWFSWTTALGVVGAFLLGGTLLVAIMMHRRKFHVFSIRSVCAGGLSLLGPVWFSSALITLGFLLSISLLLLFTRGFLFVLVLLSAAPFLLGVLSASLTWMMLREEVDDSMDLEEFFPPARITLRTAVSFMLLAGGIALGTLLYVVPGVFLAIRFPFAGWSVAHGAPGIFRAFGHSFRLTAGSGWSVYLLVVFLTAINLIGLACVGIGLVVTIPYTIAVLTCTYRRLAAPPLLTDGRPGTVAFEPVTS